MANTKKHWKEIVEPDDLDAHMLEVGQASVNAALVREMTSQFPIPAGGTLYVPGCGTGQIFDFIKPDEFGAIKFLFADIKPEFLAKLRTRLGRSGATLRAGSRSNQCLIRKEWSVLSSIRALD